MREIGRLRQTISDQCSYSDVSIISVTTESAVITSAGDDDDEIKSKLSAQLSPVSGELVTAYIPVFFASGSLLSSSSSRISKR